MPTVVLGVMRQPSVAHQNVPVIKEPFACLPSFRREQKSAARGLPVTCSSQRPSSACCHPSSLEWLCGLVISEAGTVALRNLAAVVRQERAGYFRDRKLLYHRLYTEHRDRNLALGCRAGETSGKPTIRQQRRSVPQPGPVASPSFRRRSMAAMPRPDRYRVPCS